MASFAWARVLLKLLLFHGPLYPCHDLDRARLGRLDRLDHLVLLGTMVEAQWARRCRFPLRSLPQTRSALQTKMKTVNGMKQRLSVPLAVFRDAS